MNPTKHLSYDLKTLSLMTREKELDEAEDSFDLAFKIAAIIHDAEDFKPYDNNLSQATQDIINAYTYGTNPDFMRKVLAIIEILKS